MLITLNSLNNDLLTPILIFYESFCIDTTSCVLTPECLEQGLETLVCIWNPLEIVLQVWSSALRDITIIYWKTCETVDYLPGGIYLVCAYQLYFILKNKSLGKED